MKKLFSRSSSFFLALVLFCSCLVPTVAYAEEAGTNEIQIEKTANESYAYYDLKDDGTKGAALDSAINSYVDAEKGSVETSKTIEATQTENEFLINLKVTTTEDFQSLELSEDAAVVLVLDRSGSMQWDLSGRGYCDYIDSKGNKCENYGEYVKQSQCAWYHFWGQPSRFQIMCDSLVGTDAKKGFLDSFIEDSNNAQRKVSVVTFGGENEPTTTLGWTDVKTESGMNAVKQEVSFDNITSAIRSQTSQGHGLIEAISLLENDDAIKDIPNRYVILLTDGRPEGSEPIKDGSHTEQYAEIIKKDYNTVLYSIGFGTADIKMYDEKGTPVNEWLENKVSSPDSFIAAQSGEELDLGLSKISQTISAIANAWHVIDPMGENIEFERFTSSTSAASFASNKINWDLNKENPVKKDGKNTYNLQYKVRLDNTKSTFVEGKSYLANGYTDLSYFFIEEVIENGKVIVNNTSAIRHLNFRVPAVEGYKGELIFNKVSSDSKETLPGATFMLTHNSNCSVCKGNVEISSQEATCDGNGKVVINNIPSGHEYTLTETKTPEGYIGGKTADVKVAYDKVFLDDVEVSDETPGIVENEPIKPVSTVLRATKELKDGTLVANQFKFVLKNAEGKVIDTQYNAANGDIIFEEQIYSAPGTYTYTISEVIEDGRDMAYIYDETIHNVQVTVGVNNKENPTEYVIESVTYGGSANAPKFVNSLRSGTEVVLSGTKTMDEGKPADSAFKFVLKDENGSILQTKANDSNGNVTFDALKFDKVGTYNYTINEYVAEDAAENIVYDYTTYDVEILISYPDNNHDDLQKKVTITKGETNTNGTFEFANQTRTPATLNLTATKSMENEALVDGAFSFVLEGTDVNGRPISQTKTNDSDGNINFDTLYFDKSGTYTYTISEIKGTNPDIIYDHTVYTVTVKVTAPVESDKFEIAVTYSPDESLAFTNTTREHIFVPLKATKTMNGQNAEAGAFTFQLKNSNGEVEDTVTNIENGVINFKELEFGKEGVYTYTISEVKGDNEQIVYDRTVYDVSITVTAPEHDGAYEADVKYSAEDVVFRNKSREPAIVNLTALKLLDEELAEAGKFEFELIDKEGKVVQLVKNDADGVITFNPLSFNESGIYVYKITEKEGKDKWMDYDESVYTVTIDVTADTDSDEAFQSIVTIEKDGKSYEGTPEFINKTIPKPISTGDKSHIMLYVVLTGVSLGVAITILKRRRFDR